MNTIRRTLVILSVAALLAGGMSVLATEDLGKEPGLNCTACHDKAGSKKLTDKGLYFETMRTMDGYDQLHANFGRCTACHVKNPGSDKLTKKGKKVGEVVDDMDDLREWLKSGHPTPSDDATADPQDD